MKTIELSEKDCKFIYSLLDCELMFVEGEKFDWSNWDMHETHVKYLKLLRDKFGGKKI